MITFIIQHGNTCLFTIENTRGVNMGICDYLQYEIYCGLTWKYVRVQYETIPVGWGFQHGNTCLFAI